MQQALQRAKPDANRMPAPLATIIEDDADVRRSINQLLETVGLESQSFSRAQDAIDLIAPDRPGCLIVDMRLPDRDGLDLVQDLRKQGIQTPVVVITAFGDVPSAVRAMKLSVCDFFEKPFPDQQFLGAVQKAVDQDLARFKREISCAVQLQRIESLSERERDVLEGIVEGNSSKAIAADLGLSPKTVENYRASLMDKLDANNVAHLVTLVYDYFRGKGIGSC